MDNQLFDYLHETGHKFNPRLASGIATEFMKSVEDYISRMFESAQLLYPDDLKFIRIERVDPQIDFNNRVWQNTYNVVPSDTYMVKVLFEFKGKPMKPYHMLLPYVRPGGLIYINGAQFLISPVLIDEGLSIGDKSIFIHVNKDKIRFMRSHYAMKKDGFRVNGYVAYSDVYNGKPPSDIPKRQLRRTHQMKPVLSLYLLAKKGVHQAYKEYFNAEVVIGRDEITKESFPEHEWVICESMGLKPATLVGRWYDNSDIKVAIKRSDYTLAVEDFTLGLFYVTDHHFELASGADLNDQTTWRLFLGVTLKPEEHSNLTCLNAADRHLASLDNHLDVQVLASLASIGVFVNDIYDLFRFMLFEYTKMIVQPTHQLATMYGKRLALLRYILSTINDKIFKAGYKLQTKKNDKNLSEKDIDKILSKFIKVNDINSINNKHKEVESAASATDNLIPKLTSRLVLQKDLTSSKKTDKFSDDKVLDVSIGEVGNLTADSGDKTGRSRLNMFAHVSEEGTILRNPELLEITERAQKYIQR